MTLTSFLAFAVDGGWPSAHPGGIGDAVVSPRGGGDAESGAVLPLAQREGWKGATGDERGGGDRAGVVRRTGTSVAAIHAVAASSIAGVAAGARRTVPVA